MVDIAPARFFMDKFASNFKVLFIRREFRVAWILLIVALGAFLVEVIYVPFELMVVEAGFTVVIVVLTFAIAYQGVRASVALEEGKGELESLIMSVVDPLIIYDVDFRVTLFNAAAEQLFRLNAQAVIGHVLSPRDVSVPGWRVLAQTIFPSLAPRVIAQSREGERPQIFDLTFTDPEFDLRVITSPILNAEGKTTAFLKIIHDGTPQAAALRSKTEFVTIASHQFRGPVTDISWALQALAADAGMSESSKAIVTNALAASQGLIRRIEDLLNVAKMEEGRAGYAFEETDVPDFVGRVIAEVLPAAHKAGVKVYFDRPTESLPHVMIDTRQLSIALVNILENAIRYNVENGEVFVRVIASRKSRSCGFQSGHGHRHPARSRRQAFQEVFPG